VGKGRCSKDEVKGRVVEEEGGRGGVEVKGGEVAEGGGEEGTSDLGEGMGLLEKAGGGRRKGRRRKRKARSYDGAEGFPHVPQ
jgi:hypothetical protein